MLQYFISYLYLSPAHLRWARSISALYWIYYSSFGSCNAHGNLVSFGNTGNTSCCTHSWYSCSRFCHLPDCSLSSSLWTLSVDGARPRTLRHPHDSCSHGMCKLEGHNFSRWKSICNMLLNNCFLGKCNKFSLPYLCLPSIFSNCWGQKVQHWLQSPCQFGVKSDCSQLNINFDYPPIINRVFYQGSSRV